MNIRGAFCTSSRKRKARKERRARKVIYTEFHQDFFLREARINFLRGGGGRVGTHPKKNK